jgi:phosphomannomutase
VGEANVVEMMKAHGCVIGGEGNGGVIDPRVVYVRDSLVAMALVLDLLAADDLTVAEAVGQVPSYAMVKEKITCDAHRIGPVLDAVRRTFTDGRINNVDGVRIDWEAERKWVHVRGSNTEPIMRIIAEAVDATDAQDLIGRVRRAVE